MRRCRACFYRNQNCKYPHRLCICLVVIRRSCLLPSEIFTTSEPGEVSKQGQDASHGGRDARHDSDLPRAPGTHTLENTFWDGHARQAEPEATPADQREEDTPIPAPEVVSLYDGQTGNKEHRAVEGYHRWRIVGPDVSVEVFSQRDRSETGTDEPCKTMRRRWWIGRHCTSFSVGFCPLNVAGWRLLCSQYLQLEGSRL